jgi:hypothetical protein
MATKTKAFQASSKHGNVVRNTARQAAIAFFFQFPTARTCTVREGEIAGELFIYSYGCKRYPDVSRKNMMDLPGYEDQANV